MSTVSVDGRELRLTNLAKVLWPETGFTKAQLIDYYVAVAPVLLRHLERVRTRHARDLTAGAGWVELPDALETVIQRAVHGQSGNCWDIATSGRR